ncbi:MAG: tryptophan synthase subunit alpha [Methanotrichaceae archaeon]|nr:tryptophan synthase subunit alpha [Methanotrichaceae archaeon]
MRISDAFHHKPLLIAYICAGDPSPAATPELVKRISEAGADIIELGLPHSDPVADGPTIQESSQRAIVAGMNTDTYFEVVSAAKVEIPKIFMGYYNMIYARGLEKFASDCARSGINGVIVPDLPPEEAEPLKIACQNHGVDLIFLAAPNTPQHRLERIVDQTSGFLYLVARPGVTGVRSDLLDDTKNLIARVPDGIPKAVGFGISTPEQAAEIVSAGADAVIVGSACVDLIAKGKLAELEDLIRKMKLAIEIAEKRKIPTVC